LMSAGMGRSVDRSVGMVLPMRLVLAVVSGDADTLSVSWHGQQRDRRNGRRLTATGAIAEQSCRGSER
jgi:hypothetical protein